MQQGNARLSWSARQDVLHCSSRRWRREEKITKRTRFLPKLRFLPFYTEHKCLTRYRCTSVACPVCSRLVQNLIMLWHCQFWKYLSIRTFMCKVWSLAPSMCAGNCLCLEKVNDYGVKNAMTRSEGMFEISNSLPTLLPNRSVWIKNFVFGFSEYNIITITESFLPRKKKDPCTWCSSSALV